MQLDTVSMRPLAHEGRRRGFGGKAQRLVWDVLNRAVVGGYPVALSGSGVRCSGVRERGLHYRHFWVSQRVDGYLESHHWLRAPKQAFQHLNIWIFL